MNLLQLKDNLLGYIRGDSPVPSEPVIPKSATPVAAEESHVDYLKKIESEAEDVRAALGADRAEVALLGFDKEFNVRILFETGLTHSHTVTFNGTGWTPECAEKNASWNRLVEMARRAGPRLSSVN